MQLSSILNLFTNFPTMGRSIAYAVASVVGVVALLWLRKIILPWLQAYRNSQEQAQGAATKTQVSKEDQAANADSAALEADERKQDGD